MSAIPDSVGPYSIEGEIGRGGMGVVYRARDTKLDRPVAIKALPEDFASSPDRLARFEREAKLLASLTHPNIAGVYGLEEVDGARYLVMEFVEGQPLSDITGRGALAVDEAVRICARVAAGVEAAHEAGVIHRDLKPGNIVVTPDGSAKVLDFGLAKELEEQGSGLDLTSTPTLTNVPHKAHTAEGKILGTAAYTSPEQARGKQLDKRTDIWSFGCVLFECLTGRGPFEGETTTDSFGAILHKDPDWSLLPANTPASVRLLLKRMLTKDAQRRLRDIGDARVELEEVLLDPSATSMRLADAALSARAGRGRGAGSGKLGWIVAAAFAIVAVYAGWRAWFAPSTEPGAPPIRLLVRVGADEAVGEDAGPQYAISPDGRTLVFCSGESQATTALHVRRLDQLEAIRLSGTEGALHPRFSPDGQWVAFFTSDSLKKVSINGGSPLTLCDVAGNPRGASWGDDGNIIFAPDTTDCLKIIPSGGGVPRDLTTLTDGERSHRWPYVLPGSSLVFFTSQNRGTNFDSATIEVLDVLTGERTPLHHGGSFPLYLRSGHLVFGREGTVFASVFDPETRSLTTPPVPVLQGVITQPPNGGVDIACSDNGTLILATGESGIQQGVLHWLDLDGSVSVIDPTPRAYATCALSPDGARVALQIVNEGGSSFDIWTYNIARSVLSRLTFTEVEDMTPVWSPDGTWIVYSSLADSSTPNLWMKRSDGSDMPQRLTTSDYAQFATSWSEAHNSILFSEDKGTTDWDIMVLAMDEPDAEPKNWIQTPFAEGNAVFSPDGDHVAYQSNESGRYEVYIRAYPGPGGRWQVSTSGARHPIWSPDGTRLMYLNENSMYEASVSVENGVLSIGSTELVMDMPPGFPDGGGVFFPVVALTPDAQRFATILDDSIGELEQRQELTFIFNWFTEIERLVGE